ncbi:MAG: type I restriction endonuclease subunit R [Calditrichaeota bacterium]|nr:type I restriction endonuclease subunit R [Calditrichota bacterium]
MPTNTREIAFEAAIETNLLSNGYTQGDPEKFDRTRAIFPEDVLAFVQETQPKEWEYLVNLQKDKAAEQLLSDLCRALDSEQEGCLMVLRHGFKCFGKLFRVAFFAPASGMNPDTLAHYQANRLTVTRQLHYSTKNENSLDLVLSLNGIPIATAELKNPMSGQNWRHAIHQYKFDREASEPIFKFKKRALVHFAVDPDEVYMTTKLAGGATYFLPFNLGDHGGAGNPENSNGYKTAYLWETVWQRDNFLDLFARFVHLQIEEKKIDGKKIRKETVIFPRYHQWDAVRKMEAHAREHGVGTNYLVQHSAGSGKSNTIAWLAHRLASLHDAKDEKVFDSVIVITDRIVLDQQLQNTIYQFEHKSGVVQKIDQDSTQLAASLGAGVPVIITTLQKFPFVTEKVGKLDAKKYAVIVDEAHSSQGGESAMEVKNVLAGPAVTEAARKRAEEEGLPDYQEEIIKTMLARGKQDNISYFAFTATPKYKTLEVFGEMGVDGKPQPFHLYSMRQAIEEGFILDVLKNYTTYKSYYRLIKSVEDDPELDKRKAARALARFMSLHPHNIAQKSEVMIEHYWTFVRHKIGGKAKAMVVTGSRLHAVRYKEAFDEYISERRYPLKALVAFSGTVIDPDMPSKEYTEVGMNRGLKERELPEKFASDEYRVLIVAEKYQTGFDQPFLHTMYVDKKLSGIQAVQTLSRLNRTASLKEDTFVLDFVNETEEIQAAFQPFFEQTAIGERAEIGQLYELKAKLDGQQVYFWQEVEEFCRVFYKPQANQSPADHERMNACLDPAVVRFTELPEEEREVYRKTLVGYRNLYSFMSQIIPFQDTDLELLYTYIRFLIRKLPRRESGPAIDLDDDVALKYYRLQKISEGSISLERGKIAPISGPTEVGTGVVHDVKAKLSQLIDILNEKFGTEFKPGDQLFFDSVTEDAVANQELRQAANVNTHVNFDYLFRRALEGLIIDRMSQNEDIAARMLNDKDMNETVASVLSKQVYERIRGKDR